jgi:predicted nuclease with TOPRIM domain
MLGAANLDISAIEAKHAEKIESLKAEHAWDIEEHTHGLREENSRLKEACELDEKEIDTLRKTMAELERSSAYVESLNAEMEDSAHSQRTEIETLRATMAGMICGNCKGSKGDPYAPNLPCPVCQPKKEGT